MVAGFVSGMRSELGAGSATGCTCPIPYSAGPFEHLPACPTRAVIGPVLPLVTAVLNAREEVGPAAETNRDEWCVDCGHWHGVHDVAKCNYWTGLCACVGFVKRSDALKAVRGG